MMQASDTTIKTSLETNQDRPDLPEEQAKDKT